MRIAAATDVGGGTSYSMLRTMDEGYKVMQLRGQKLNPLRRLLQMTLGNAQALSPRRPRSARSSRAATPISWCSMPAHAGHGAEKERIETLAEELFLLQTLGDDRAVREVYVAGRPAKSSLAA